MSALPPKTDIRQREWHVRYVPEAEPMQVVRLGLGPINSVVRHGSFEPDLQASYCDGVT
jgi:hypothetical protein